MSDKSEMQIRFEEAISHLQWCLEHVVMRCDDGSERKLTMDEAAEFIELTKAASDKIAK